MEMVHADQELQEESLGIVMLSVHCSGFVMSNNPLNILIIIYLLFFTKDNSIVLDSQPAVWRETSM